MSVDELNRLLRLVADSWPTTFTKGEAREWAVEIEHRTIATCEATIRQLARSHSARPTPDVFADTYVATLRRGGMRLVDPHVVEAPAADGRIPDDARELARVGVAQARAVLFGRAV